MINKCAHTYAHSYLFDVIIFSLFIFTLKSYLIKDKSANALFNTSFKHDKALIKSTNEDRKSRTNYLHYLFD